MNKRSLIVIVLLLVSCLTVSSQEIEGLGRFAGTWKTSARETGIERTMIITVSGNTIELSETYVSRGRTYTDKGVYFADRRGEKNLLEMPELNSLSEVPSKTEYKNGKLVIDASYSVEVRGGTRGEVTTSDHKVRKEFVLSADRGTLKANKRTILSNRVSNDRLSPELRRTSPNGGGGSTPPFTAISVTVYTRRD